MTAGLDDLELSDAAREHLDAMPTRGGVAEVLANYGRRSREEALAEKRERQRLEAAQARREDFVEAARMEGRELRPVWAPLLDWEVASAVADRGEEARRQKEQEARQADLERQLADAKARLAAEQKRSQRAAGLAGRYQRRASKAEANASWAARVALKQDRAVREATGRRDYWR